MDAPVLDAPAAPEISVAPSPPRRPRRRALRFVVIGLVGSVAAYALACLTVSLVILGMSGSARAADRDGERAALPGVPNFAHVDERVWRGGAPSEAGYRRLAALGVRTVVDMRAEQLPADERAAPGRAGLRVVALPVRDGQVPTEEQIARFLAVVRDAGGPVFLHCGAGVGRSGTMAATYLVRTGQADADTATERSLAIGPPSLEQVAFMRRLDRGAGARPPAAVVALSRIADSPRRSWSRLR